MTEKRKMFLIYLAIGFVIAVAVLIYRWDAEKLISFQLCDATFVAGGLLVSVGGLKFARNGGTFDIMVYGIDSALRITFPSAFKERKDADFVAYKERKRESRKPATAELLSGAVYLVLAFICLVIYHLQA